MFEERDFSFLVHPTSERANHSHIYHYQSLQMHINGIGLRLQCHKTDSAGTSSFLAETLINEHVKRFSDRDDLF